MLSASRGGDTRVSGACPRVSGSCPRAGVVDASRAAGRGGRVGGFAHHGQCAFENPRTARRRDRHSGALSRRCPAQKARRAGAPENWTGRGGLPRWPRPEHRDPQTMPGLWGLWLVRRWSPLARVRLFSPAGPNVWPRPTGQEKTTPGRSWPRRLRVLPGRPDTRARWPARRLRRLLRPDGRGRPRRACPGSTRPGRNRGRN